MQNNNKLDKRTMDIVKHYISDRITLSLYVADKEKKALKEMGYDPEGLICIERLTDESVFIKFQVTDVVTLDRMHGGGGSVYPRPRFEEKTLAFLKD